MGVRSTIWLGRIILFGGVAFILFYAFDADFRRYLYQLIMGPG